jgi:hypothetical protein
MLVVRPFGTCTRTYSLPSFVGTSAPTSIDLSKAIKLKDVVFQLNEWWFGWITTTLQTITPEHQDLRQISVLVDFTIPFLSTGPSAETIGEQCLGLDRLLVQLWESHSIQPKVECTALRGKEQDARDSVGRLLPEITKKGIINLVVRGPARFW